MSLSRPIAALGFAIVSVGCSGRPTESLAREAVKTRLAAGSTSRIELVDFVKTDGQAAEMAGVKVYTMKFTAAARFLDEAYFTTGGSIVEPDININTKPISETPRTCGQDLRACFSQAPLRTRKGDRINGDSDEA